MIKTLVPMQGAQVQCVVRELRSQMLQGEKKKIYIYIYIYIGCILFLW